MNTTVFISLFKVIWQRSKLWFTFSILVRIIEGLLPLATLYITKELIDEVAAYVQGAQGSDINTIIVLILLEFAIVFFKSMLSMLTGLLDTYTEIRLDYYFSKKVSLKSIRVPLTYFELPDFYHHLERIRGDYGNRVMGPVRSVLEIGRSIITLGSYLFFLFTIHWSIAILSLVAAVPIYRIQAKYGSAKFHLMRFQTPAAREASYTSALLNDRDASKEVRIFSLGNYLINRWKKIYWLNNNQMFKLIKREKVANLGLETFTAIIYSGCALIVVWLLKTSKIGIGQFVTMGQAIQGAQTSMNIISFSLASIYEQFLYIDDLFKFLEYEQKEYNPKQIENPTSFPSSLYKGIEVKNISFTYPGSSKKVLDDVSFHIKPGEKIAIVGENGSGKTTLVKCLMGLYPISKGTITFDDVEIETIDKQDLYRNTTVIFQDFTTYAYTVKENIVFGDIEQEEDDAKLKRVAEQTGVDTFVQQLPDKYETRLGKFLFEGEDLSGGQWQRIAMARALYREAKIVVLDEPTAALDPQTELEVFNQFKNLSADKTTLFISHRMAAAKMADRIFVMKEGKLLEVGTHEELINKRQEYYRMFNMQAKWYA
ncbi:ABC transporter ATP-binding protein [Longirhabdus pacifica]|uniref:ABC transporter ATP-binding protein n=1 Tax=Longirhabdus pacifica TaxID=2305227 RepID=UPI0010089B0E|nr:ABC transporter ATP-binding protein [Longirhabdus pacifica]